MKIFVVICITILLCSTHAQACRPKLQSVAQHYQTSQAVFTATVVRQRNICTENGDGDLRREIPCSGRPSIEIYPVVEVTLKPHRRYKGSQSPATIRVSGCGYGGWSRNRKTLVFADSMADGNYAYFIASERTDYRHALAEVKRLARQR